MYFSGTLAVDPSQLTHIEKVKPTKAFKRVLYLLTAGLVSDKEEQETFTALSVLQQLNACFRRMGVTDIVRLAKDDVDFYLDEEGRRDDLKEALTHFRLEVDHIESQLFESLHMILEHEDDELKYLIQIDINRTHKVGEYPIVLKVNGLIKEFKSMGEDQNAARERMNQVFASQTAYDTFVNRHRARFDRFLAELEMNLKISIHADDVRCDSKARVMRPQNKPQSAGQVFTANPSSQPNYHHDPIYHGYYATSNFFFYAWLWSDMCHHHGIHMADFAIVDEAGATLAEVGEVGIDAGGALMDTEVPFDTARATDATLPDAMADTPADSGGDDSGSWFDSFLGGSDDGGGGDGGSDSGCSSCSSCSSCGGGCGGCS